MSSHFDSISAEDRVVLYAVGAITAEEAGPEAVRDADQYAALVAHLVAGIPPVPPPAGLQDRLRSAIAAPNSGGFTFRHLQQAEFIDSPFPGIRVRVLNLDRTRRRVTAVLQLEPGAVYPSHHHRGEEECYVLEGELIVGEVRMRAGDYQYAEAGSDHVEQRTETGATILINAPLDLLFMKQTADSTSSEK